MLAILLGLRESYWEEEGSVSSAFGISLVISFFFSSSYNSTSFQWVVRSNRSEENDLNTDSAFVYFRFAFI